mgnify:CR=1 FL=1
MEFIHCDIETYSSIDLGKCGVYRYAEAEDFEVLLFGYSVDGGEVQVVDLAGGEKLPEKIREALMDEKVIKVAHNANFERVCLSRFLGLPPQTFLPPQQWRCTMTWAAYMGLQLLERERQVSAQMKDKDFEPDFSGKEYIIERQLKPEARRDVIAEMHELGIRPTAMMDVSDGLSSELLHICKDSGPRS